MNDDELLALLASSIAPSPVEPPTKSLAAFHRVVAEAAHKHGATRYAPRRWLAPLVAGAVFFGGTGVAVAADTPVRRAAHQVAHSIGLPVDSPQLDDARELREKLQRDLERGDAAAIVAHAAQLRTALDGLDRDERGQVQNQADQVLQQADEHNTNVDNGQGGSQGGGPVQIAPPPSGATGATDAPVVPTTDGGSGDISSNGSGSNGVGPNGSTDG